MNAVGIICEYNPFHNGHLHHIKEVKKKFPDSTIVLILNGYFLERGEVSIISKYAKTGLALHFGVDLVVELPFVYGTQSADIFASKSLEILNHLKVDKLVFGSECNDSNMLKRITDIQLYDEDYNTRVQYYLKSGNNYPTALAKALNVGGFDFLPNDLLGISYIKAIYQNEYKIMPYTIQRTSGYHDTESNNTVISASNIRKKIKGNEEFDSYLPKEVIPFMKEVNETTFFHLLKYKIISSHNLEIYLDVDEGIEHRLQEQVLLADSLEDFIQRIKTKRYTYNKIRRMLIHILIGLKKVDNKTMQLDYIHVLGFRKAGQQHLYKIKKDVEIPLSVNHQSKLYQYEQKACLIYDILTNSQESIIESQNKPIIQ